MEINPNYGTPSVGDSPPNAAQAYEDILDLAIEAIGGTGNKPQMQQLLATIGTCPSIQNSSVLTQSYKLFTGYMNEYFSGSTDPNLGGYINGSANALRSLLTSGVSSPIPPTFEQGICLKELAGQYRVLQAIIDGDSPQQGIAPTFMTISYLLSQLANETTNPCMRDYFNELSQQYANLAKSNPTTYEAASFVAEFQVIKIMFGLSS